MNSNLAKVGKPNDGRRAKAAIRLENRQALGQPFLKASFGISRWSGLKRA
jgi:hypothetical protein